MSLNKLGRYDLIRVLGKGAMGLVYEARDPNLDRRVAIKTIKVENLSEEAAAEYEARFRTEARSAARLQHPNIVSVYDSDRHGDVAFLVMEFIEGEDLKHHLDSGKRYSLEQSLRMVGDLLSALEYAHRQSVVHRDVKPANLLIENDGRVKLTDFGVARIQDSSEATRTQGSMVGTLKYMSPEQVQGQPIDARADLFAVGIVLYQLLTGRRPFDGDTDFAIIQKIVGHTPDRPSLFNPLLPPAIDAVVLRALAKKREQRFTTAQDFARALQEASGQASDPTIVPPTSQPGGNATDAGRQRSHVGGSTVKLSSSGTDTGSTVTQELELVYWKDIKDSDDLEDLEGFLGRFPSGIYADLARRRVKRLTGTASDEGLGEGSGTATLAAAAPAADAEWARLQAQNVLKPAALASARVTASTVEANDPDATRMAGAGLPLADPRSPAAVAEPSPAVPTASRSKLPLFALAGVAVLVAAVVIFKRLPGTAAPVQVALPAVASEAPAASPAPPAALPRTPKPLPKPKSARLAAAETVVEPAAALATASNPGQACENRILLGFQRCMNEQCAKPAFSKHPVCVERRAMDKLRRESQEVRN